MKNRLSKLTSIFDPILDSTLLHFGIPNPPKSFQISIPRCIEFSIDFCIVFSSILLRFWKPTWSHVGHFFVQNTGTLTKTWVLYVGSIFVFGFLGRPGPLLAPSGLDLGGFGPPFWRFLVPIFFTISKFFAPTFSATLALC